MQRGMPMNDSKKRVVLIGPVYPYKGGISHYTSLMYRALSENYLVEMVSYRLQYPRFLFRKEQKDYSNDSFKIKGTKYWINTMAPWNWIECRKNQTAKAGSDYHPMVASIFYPLLFGIGLSVKKVQNSVCMS